MSEELMDNGKLTCFKTESNPVDFWVNLTISFNKSTVFFDDILINIQLNLIELNDNVRTLGNKCLLM